MDVEDCVPCVDYGTGEVYLMPRSALRTATQTKKRPLGRLERQPFRYTPPQPVLSCQSLDIDKSGSRTYRAKSTSAIIEEQHQLLHAVYMANRVQKESRSPRSSDRSPHVNQLKPLDQKKRRFLTINGSNRPWTSLERPKSTSEPKRRRPHTTGGSVARPKQSSKETHFVYKKDPGIEESTEKFNSTNRRIQNLWRPENHILDDGLFNRARSDMTTSASSGNHNQWLNFAGGDQQATGLVQAFTSAMKGQGDYYSIDGTVGTHVARQLRRGDKIRVGINGDVQSTDLKVKKWLKEDQRKTEPMGEEKENNEEPPKAMPLSWSEQLKEKDVTILEPSAPRQRTSRPNYCETHPVVFEKLISDDPAHLARDFRAFRGNNTWSAEGFAVRSRVKPRIGIDGSTTQQITNMTIDKKLERDENIEGVSVEAILEKRLHGNSKNQEGRRQDLGISNLTNLSHHNAETMKKTHTPPTSARSKSEEGQAPSRMSVGSGLGFSSGDSRSVRPLTAHSANNIDPHFDTFVVTSAASVSLKPGSSRSGSRACSGKRPPPAKPSLHKSAAAMGASIGSQSSKGDPEYIKITHSLSRPKRDTDNEGLEGEEHGIPPPTPNSADLSLAGDNDCDQELSQDGFSDFEVDFEEAQSETETNNKGLDDFEEQQQVARPPTPESLPVYEEVSEEAELQGLDDTKDEDIRYAFDIPTAEEVDEEEVEDSSDKPSLHDRLVEQTAELLAGAIIGADLPDQFTESRPASKQSRPGTRQSQAKSISFENNEKLS